METHLSTTQRAQCAIENVNLPNQLMCCKVFETYVEVGDFLIVSQPTGSDIVGWLIDVKDLDDICVDEVSLEDEIFFFLDNGADGKKERGLIEIWKEVDSSQRGFERLNLQDAYKLKGIQELLKLRKAMWFGQFNASNLGFVFPPEEMTSGRFPPLNGMKNLFFVGTLNGMGSTDILTI